MRVQAAGGRGGQAQTVAQATRASTGIRFASAERNSPSGVGTRATSVLFVNLNGGAERFSAMVGADDNPILLPPVPRRPATAGARRRPRRSFFAPSATAACSTSASRSCEAMRRSRSIVDVRGIRTLVLQVKPVDGNRPVAANWADAKFDRERRSARRARCSRRAARGAHAEARTGAAHQRAVAHRSDAGA